LTKRNVGATIGRPQNRKKVNKDNKNILKMLIPLIGAIIFIYMLYKIISLIIVPTDIVMIENGTIFNEESATRICYKTWKDCKRK